MIARKRLRFGMWVLEAMRGNDRADLHQVDEVKLGGLVGGKAVFPL